MPKVLTTLRALLAAALFLTPVPAFAQASGNLACMTVDAAPGTLTIMLDVAVTGNVSFAEAGIPDDSVISYSIKDGSQSEAGRGTYDANTQTLTRGAITSTDNNAEINASAGAKVCVSALAEDFEDRQPIDQALTDISGLAVTDGNIIVGNGTNWVAESGATARTSLGLAIGTDVQAYDDDLASWAGVTRASGFDTWVATPSSANLAAAVTGETGSGALVFGTSPALTTPDLGTPSAGTLTNAT
ncbi:MAG: hypothetical protein ACRECF_00765 [Methyloceanibacter sp.]